MKSSPNEPGRDDNRRDLFWELLPYFAGVALIVVEKMVFDQNWRITMKAKWAKFERMVNAARYREEAINRTVQREKAGIIDAAEAITKEGK